MDIGQEKYNYYLNAYVDAISNMHYKFDNDFIDIYKNGKYIIDGKEYGIKEVYLVKLDNGKFHLIKAGENKKDIITGKMFDGKKEMICCFRNTNIFYELYKNKKISNEIILDDYIGKYVYYWNGEKHKEVPELLADSIAQEKYGLKYGK